MSEALEQSRSNVESPSRIPKRSPKIDTFKKRLYQKRDVDFSKLTEETTISTKTYESFFDFSHLVRPSPAQEESNEHKRKYYSVPRIGNSLFSFPSEKTVVQKISMSPKEHVATNLVSLKAQAVKNDDEGRQKVMTQFEQRRI